MQHEPQRKFGQRDVMGSHKHQATDSEVITQREGIEIEESKTWDQSWEYQIDIKYLKVR